AGIERALLWGDPLCRAATDQRSRSPKRVFTMTETGVHDARNRCSPSTEMGVHVRPKQAFTLVRNTQVLRGFADRDDRQMLTTGGATDVARHPNTRRDTHTR